MSADVAEVGAQNAYSYASRAAALIAVHPDLVALAELFRHAYPSSNAYGDKLREYDSASAILDTRAIWVARKGGDSAAGIAAFELAQGPEWLPKRQGFEDIWSGGRNFLYAVVNAGNTGPRGYGPFCMIIRPDRVSGKNTAVFPGNTARLYGRETGRPDSSAAKAEAGIWSMVSDMAVTTFGEEATRVPEPDWPFWFCNDDDPSNERFLEVAIDAPVTLADVIEIRLRAAVHADLNAWSQLARRRALNDRTKLNAVEGWQIINRWVKRTHPHINLRIL